MTLKEFCKAPFMSEIQLRVVQPDIEYGLKTRYAGSFGCLVGDVDFYSLILDKKIDYIDTDGDNRLLVCLEGYFE